MRRTLSSQPLVYLCGPINGCSDNECINWRDMAKRKFKRTLDPMDRDYRGREQESYREIVDLDKRDVVACDAILAFCPKPSVGTSMEILMAWQLGKVIAVVAPDPVSPWLRYHSTRVFAEIDEAIDWLGSLL